MLSRFHLGRLSWVYCAYFLLSPFFLCLTAALVTDTMDVAASLLATSPEGRKMGPSGATPAVGGQLPHYAAWGALPLLLSFVDG